MNDQHKTDAENHTFIDNLDRETKRVIVESSIGILCSTVLENGFPPADLADELMEKALAVYAVHTKRPEEAEVMLREWAAKREAE